LKLYCLTNQADNARILAEGFDPLDGFLGSPALLLFQERTALNGRPVIELDIPAAVAARYAHRRDGAKPDEPPAVYRLPVDLANHYLRQRTPRP
jgi:hypothetical protein